MTALSKESESYQNERTEKKTQIPKELIHSAQKKNHSKS